MKLDKYNVSVVFADPQDAGVRLTVTLTGIERGRLQNMRLSLGKILEAVEEAVAASAAGGS